MWERAEALTYWEQQREFCVIELTKFNGAAVWVNPDLLQSIEANPDTRVTLTTGVRLLVEEDPVTIARRIVQYRRSIYLEERTPEAAFELIQFSEES